MKLLMAVVLLASTSVIGEAQSAEASAHVENEGREDAADAPNLRVALRLALLVAPVTPLASLQVALGGGVAIQAETDFHTTHGITLQWFHGARPLCGGYLLAALALVDADELQEDRYTPIPYAGYGWQFAQLAPLVMELRAGLGVAIRTAVGDVLPVPVVKVSIGLVL